MVNRRYVAYYFAVSVFSSSVFAVGVSVINPSVPTKINRNYEMTVQVGTENIQPVEFFDNGVATFLKFKTGNVKVKKEELSPKFTVFYLNKDGKEVIAPSYELNTELNILAFPFVANEWRIRSGTQVVGIRRTEPSRVEALRP